MLIELVPVLYSLSLHLHSIPTDFVTHPTADTEPVKAHFDLVGDSSIHRFVGQNVGLDDASYVPPNMTVIQSTPTLQTQGTVKLRPEAYVALKNMSNTLYADIGHPLVVVSAYRSFGHQLHINNVYGADTLRAKAGHSEHQLGLAIDILGLTNASIANNPQYAAIYAWMVDNAHRFGYTQSYQYGPAIDGYERENRHRRYLGVELATLLYDQSITFTQYYEANKFRP